MSHGVVGVGVGFSFGLYLLFHLAAELGFLLEFVEQMTGGFDHTESVAFFSTGPPLDPVLVREVATREKPLRQQAEKVKVGFDDGCLGRGPLLHGEHRKHRDYEGQAKRRKKVYEKC